MPPDREVDQLLGGIHGRERALRLDRFPDHPVQALYGVRGVDHPADFWAEDKERDHLPPSSARGRLRDIACPRPEV